MLLPSALPGAPADVLGVINLRSETIPVVDLEARLPASAGRVGVDHHLVVTSIGGIAIAIAVSHVEEIEVVPEGCFQTAKEVLPAGVPLLGVARIRDELIPVIDTAGLMKKGEIMAIEKALARFEESRA